MKSREKAENPGKPGKAGKTVGSISVCQYIVRL